MSLVSPLLAAKQPARPRRPSFVYLTLRRHCDEADETE